MKICLIISNVLVSFFNSGWVRLVATTPFSKNVPSNNKSIGSMVLKQLLNLFSFIYKGITAFKANYFKPFRSLIFRTVILLLALPSLYTLYLVIVTFVPLLDDSSMQFLSDLESFYKLLYQSALIYAIAMNLEAFILVNLSLIAFKIITFIKLYAPFGLYLLLSIILFYNFILVYIFKTLPDEITLSLKSKMAQIKLAVGGTFLFTPHWSRTPKGEVVKPTVLRKPEGLYLYDEVDGLKPLTRERLVTSFADDPYRPVYYFKAGDRISEGRDLMGESSNEYLYRLFGTDLSAVVERTKDGSLTLLKELNPLIADDTTFVFLTLLFVNSFLFNLLLLPVSFGVWPDDIIVFNHRALAEGFRALPPEHQEFITNYYNVGSLVSSIVGTEVYCQLLTLIAENGVSIKPLAHHKRAFFIITLGITPIIREFCFGNLVQPILFFRVNLNELIEAILNDEEFE